MRMNAIAVTVRDATADDWPRIWPFFQVIVAAGDTFAYDPEVDETTARGMWMAEPPGRTSVAVAAGREIAGSAAMYPNHDGPGAHVASASFMVDPRLHGHGIGRAMVVDALAWARREGFLAMQFNAVAETNEGAVALYRSLGFEVLATIPEGFRHPAHGLVGLHVMHRRL
jgi:GNAT superfamily N-acetyltransferase